MKKALVALIAIFLYCLPTLVRADPIVIGNPPDADKGNCYPFGCGGGLDPGSRYQQVYSPEQFAGPFRIDEIRFFQTQELGGLLNSGSYEFFLSTTSRAVNQLDAGDFNSNIGIDQAAFATVLFTGQPASRTLSISGTPFLFDPARGNLLLDIVIPGGATHVLGEYAYLDARLGTSRGAFSRVHNFGSGFPDSGLVTEFVGTPIPEPETLLLVAIGLGAALVSSSPARQ